MSAQEKENNETMNSFKEENDRLIQENKSLSKYALGYSRRCRVTGPKGAPVYMEGTLEVDDDYFWDCCEGSDGEMDRWCAVQMKYAEGETPLTELPNLEYHIEGMHQVFFTNDLGDAKFVISIEADGTCYIELENHIIFFYKTKLPTTLSWDGLIQKHSDRWKIDNYGGRRTATFKMEVEEAADILRDFFGDEVSLAKFHFSFDMNEAGGDRFTYTPNAVEFPEPEEDNDKGKTLDELKEVNTCLKKQNRRLWSYKWACSRDVKVTGAKGTPVYCKGAASGDGAGMVRYGGILKMQPRSKGVPLQKVSSLVVHVEGEKWRTISINDLERVRCILTLSQEAKLSLSLECNGFFLESDVITSTSFGALNDLSSEWQQKSLTFYERVAKREYPLYEMPKMVREVLQGDTKAKLQIKRIHFEIHLFEGY